MSNLIKEAQLSRSDYRLMLLGVVTGLLILLVGVFDIISSNAVLHSGGGYEVNPLHRWTQQNWGAWWIVPKMLIHMVAAAMVMWFPNRAVLGAVAPILMFSGIVVWHNFQLAI